MHRLVVRLEREEQYRPVPEAGEPPAPGQVLPFPERRRFLGPESVTPNLGPFSPEVLREAESVVLADAFFEGREEVQGITIDPVGAKDLDDAIYVEQDGNGFWVSVTIADASSVILPGSLLDEVANARAFTRYWGEMGNDPMLPAVLSEDRLSLHEGQRRPTITIFIPIDEKLNFGKPEIKRTFLRSRRALTYPEADRIMFENNDTVAPVLKMGYGLARRLEYARGTDYNFEKRTEISEEGEEKQMRWGDAYLSMITVRALMIRTNMIGSKIALDMDIPFLYRGHDAIGERAYYATVYSGHDGMKLQADQPYAHLTSDLRRLSDLTDLRQLLAALEGKEPPYTQEELDQIARAINASVNAHRDRIDGGRGAYVKEIMNEQVRQALEEGRISDLDLFPPRRVTRVAAQEGHLGEIEEWLFARLEADEKRKVVTITPRDVVPILFGKQNDQITQRMVVEISTRYPTLSRQALEAFCGEKRMRRPRINERISQDGIEFAAWVSRGRWKVMTTFNTPSRTKGREAIISVLIQQLRADPFFQRKME